MVDDFIPVFELAVEFFSDLHASDKRFLKGVIEDETLVNWDGRGAAVADLGNHAAV